MKKILSIFTLLFAMQTNSIYPMQTAINLCSKLVNAQSIATYAKSLSTGIFWGHTLGPVLMGLFGEKIFSHSFSDPLGEKAKESIKKQLKDLDYPESTVTFRVYKGTRIPG